MGNSSVQNTRTAWINQGAAVPDSTYQEAGQLAVPESGSAASSSALRPATHALIDDAVREAPTSLSLPGERVGAPPPIAVFRCSPVLFTVLAASLDMSVSACRLQVSSACAPLGTRNFPLLPASFGAS